MAAKDEADYPRSDRLRILDYFWHQAHAYRLHALPADFTFVAFRPTIWNEYQRPVPENFQGAISPDDIVPAEYDFALLHLDQWCDRVNLRATPYRLMKRASQNIPQIIIMHGTPDSEGNRQAILQLIGDLPVVCNSRQAAQEWDGGDDRVDRYGLPQFRHIIHGYDTDEFWSLPVEQRQKKIVTVCSGGTISREYHGIPLVERLMRDVPIDWYGPSGNVNWLEDYMAYRAMLASNLIYFSPTRQAPMPGARTEAMLSGCCVVTVPRNDIENYITHGETGLIVDDYTEAHSSLQQLLNVPATAYQIGQAGRKTAQKHFGKERFIDDWLSVWGNIEDAIG